MYSLKEEKQSIFLILIIERKILVLIFFFFFFLSVLMKSYINRNVILKIKSESSRALRLEKFLFSIQSRTFIYLVIFSKIWVF